MKQHAFFIFLLLLSATLIRVFYARAYPAVILTPDSYSYYGLAKEQAAQGFPAYISYLRTPVYPMFIRAVMALSNNFQHVAIAQSFIAVIAVVVLYCTLFRLGIGPTVSFFLSLMHAVNMMLVPWDRMLLTESLAISWVIFYCYGIVLLLESPKVRTFFFCLILSVLGLFLRPAFLFLPVAAFTLVAFYHRKQAVTMLSAVTILYYLAFPFAYAGLNGSMNGYAGLNINGVVNLFARIIEHNFSFEPAKQIEYFYTLGTRFKALDVAYSPVGVYQYLDNGEAFTPRRLGELETFTKTIIVHTIPMFSLYSLQKIPEAFTQVSSWIALPHFFSQLQQFFLRLQLLWPVFVVFSLLSLYRFFTSRRVTFREGGMAILSALVWVQILVAVFLSADEYARLVAVIIPQFYLVVFTNFFRGRGR